MPFCMDKECGKQGLKRSDVELDPKTNEVLCHDCYYKRYPAGALEVAEVGGSVCREFAYGVHLTSTDGLHARVAYGGNFLDAHVPVAEFKELLNKLR